MSLMRISILLILIFSSVSLAQMNNFETGVSIGLGEIKGNSALITSFGSSAYVDFNLWFSNDVKFRTGFLYAIKLEYFLPESRAGRYYPSVRSFFLKSVIKQDFYTNFYFEEGLGLVYLNDKTVSDINNWQPGITFNFALGLDFTKISNTKLKFGLGIDYGLGITKTTASYYLIYLFTKIKL